MNYQLPVDYNKLSTTQRKEVREQYALIQRGKCAHCGNMLAEQPSEKIRDTLVNWKLFPKGFTKYPVHLHHCHKTNMTLGAIHAKCNAVLWQYKGE